MPNDITQELRHAPLEIDAETFKKLGYALVDRVARHLDTLPERPVTPAEGMPEVRALLGGDAPLPAQGTDPEKLLAETADLVFDHSLFNGHPRFWGYITSSPAPIGMLGDLLAAAANPNCGAWNLAPIATEMEIQTVRWIAEFMGYPSHKPGNCGGLLVSGGNMANFIGFLAGRVAMLGKEIRERGVANSTRWRIYGSAGTHTWIQKAADLFGLGTDSIRWIPVDSSQRMDLSALRKQVEADVLQGDRPMMLVGTAGSVGTGSVDPLYDLAKYAKELGVWFHVDGAYGGLAAQVEGAPRDLAGLSEADSLAVDPHKWFYAPLEAGCTLVRDPRHLEAAFSYHPSYYHFDSDITNYHNLGMQNSRGFRALKVWLALKQVGGDGYRQMLAEDIRLARYLYDLCEANPELEPLTNDLSITTFRYVPAELRERTHEPEIADRLNKLNETILDKLQTGGEAFVSNAVMNLNGQEVFALRLCIVNFHTSRTDIDALPELVVRLGRSSAPGEDIG